MVGGNRIFFILGIGVVLGAFVFWGLREACRITMVRRRRKRGIKLEARAEKILWSYGFRLLETQPEMTMTMTVDRKTVPYRIRPDGLASKKGQLYLVEVKTGATAAKLNYPTTRRQMFEYFHSMPVAGVLFVNADTYEMNVIQFSSKRKQNRKSSFWWLWLIIGATAGWFAGLAL